MQYRAAICNPLRYVFTQKFLGVCIFAPLSPPRSAAGKKETLPQGSPFVCADQPTLARISTTSCRVTLPSPSRSAAVSDPASCSMRIAASAAHGRPGEGARRQKGRIKGDFIHIAVGRRTALGERERHAVARDARGDDRLAVQQHIADCRRAVQTDGDFAHRVIRCEVAHSRANGQAAAARSGGLRHRRVAQPA